MNFTFIFERNGTVRDEGVLDNELWVDVGNKSAEGIFDHHQAGGKSSAFETVLECSDHYEGLKRYLATHADEDSEIMFHVHVYPDIDCIFSVYAIQKMIREGAENPKAAFKERTWKKLLEYVDYIDQGRKKVVSKVTLYAYFIKIGTEIHDFQGRNEKIKDEGLKLVEKVVAYLDEGNEVDLFTTPIEEYLDTSDLEYYEGMQKVLDEAKEGYLNDKKDGSVVIMPVSLLDKRTKTARSVKAAVWMKMASEEDQYIFAREDDGCVLTVYYPKEGKNGVDEKLTRVVISLNPDLKETEGLTLLPLAEMLEQFEQIEEEKWYEEKGRYRRDHGRARDTAGIFAELPFSETCDPWYISKEEDMIDAPRDGSLLPYERILSIVKNSLSGGGRSAEGPKLTTLVKEACFVSFYEAKGASGAGASLGTEPADVVCVDAKKVFREVRFGELYGITRDKLAEMKGDPSFMHLLVTVKIDPLLLRYNNAILKACCFNMVGKADSVMSKENLLYINYRSCLYTDQSITIIALADTGEAVSFLGENIADSRLCLDIRNLLAHRKVLRDIGKSLLKIDLEINPGEGQPDEIKEFNEQIVKLSARIETDGIITDSLEQDIYAAIKETFKINELKLSVIDSANLLIKNAERERDRESKKARDIQQKREKLEDDKEQARDSRLQAGIGLMACLAVFSAFVDAFDFIAKLASGTDDGWSMIWTHKIVFVLEIGVFLFIVWLGSVGIRYSVSAYHMAEDVEKNLKIKEKELQEEEKKIKKSGRREEIN